MALATTTDVESALGRSLTAEETNRATGMLERASKEVERYTGFRFEAGSYSITRTVRRGRVRIPAESPSVSEVRELDCYGDLSTVTDWTLRGRVLYVSVTGEVEVDFTTPGLTPPEVVEIVAAMVARSVTQSPDQASTVTQAGLGSAQLSYASNAAGGSVWLTKADRAILAPYRTVRASILLVRD